MIAWGVIRPTPCPAHLGGTTTGLACTCDAGHVGGHVYASSSGSWLETAS